MTPEPLRRFYDDWYRPDNAALVVVGDIDVDDIEQAIADRFESLTSRGQPPAVPDLAFVADTEPAVEVLADPDQPAAFVEVTLPVPAVASRRRRRVARRGSRRDRVRGDRRSAGVRRQRRRGGVHQRLGRLQQPRQGSRRAERARGYLAGGRARHHAGDPRRDGASRPRWLRHQRDLAARDTAPHGGRVGVRGACQGPRRRIRRVVRRQLPRRLTDPRRDDGARGDDRHPRRRHARCRRRPVPGAMDGDRSTRPRRGAGGRAIAGTRRPARHDRRARRSRTGTAGRRRHRGDRADGASRADHRIGGRVAHRGAVGVPRADAPRVPERRDRDLQRHRHHRRRRGVRRAQPRRVVDRGR